MKQSRLPRVVPTEEPAGCVNVPLEQRYVSSGVLLGICKRCNFARPLAAFVADTETKGVGYENEIAVVLRCPSCLYEERIE